MRRASRKNMRRGTVNPDELAAAEKARPETLRQARAPRPMPFNTRCRTTMQDLVGIVRREDEMLQALEQHCRNCKAQAERAGVRGHREYNAGWHTAIDLQNADRVSEIIARAALERKESRGGTIPRRLPDERRRVRRIQHRGLERRFGRGRAAPRTDSADAGRAEADHSGDEVMANATFRIWRGDQGAGAISRLHHRNHGRNGGARRHAPDSGDAGVRSGRALELQGGQVRLLLRGNQRHRPS